MPAATWPGREPLWLCNVVGDRQPRRNESVSTKTVISARRWSVVSRSSGLQQKAPVITVVTSAAASFPHAPRLTLLFALRTACECRTFSLGHIPPGRFPSPPMTFPPAVKAEIWKLASTGTSDPNRSTALNFVHVNGRSLDIVDWQMVVVEGGNVLHHVKGGGIVRKGECPDPVFAPEMNKWQLK